MYTLDGKLVQHFPSHMAAAKALGVSHQAISKAIKRNSIVKGQYRVSNKR